MTLKKESVVCPNCGQEPLYVEEYGKYYCFSCSEFLEPNKELQSEEPEEPVKEIPQSQEIPTICPKCGKEASFIEEYQRYYCFSCNEYLKITEEEAIEEPEETKEEIGKGAEEETDEGEEETEEEEEEEEEETDLAVEQEIDDYLSELYAEVPMDTQEEKKGLKPEGKKIKKKVKKYRYRTRMLKGSILPILYGVISLQMLNSIIYEFSDYYEYKIMLILGGFLLGFIALSIITITNLVRAKKSQKKGCNLNVKVGLVAYIPFLIILLTLALFVSISDAWQFSTGFFLASIFPVLFVVLYEAGSKGKFFVREVIGDPSKGRKLVFIK